MKGGAFQNYFNNDDNGAGRTACGRREGTGVKDGQRDSQGARSEGAAIPSQKFFQSFLKKALTWPLERGIMGTS